MSPSIATYSHNHNTEFDFGIKTMNSAMEKMAVSNNHKNRSATSKVFSCTRIPDECLFHAEIQNHNLYNGPKDKQIQLHILRRSYFPHTPYLYLPSGQEGTEDYVDLPSYLPEVAKNPSGSMISKASTFTAGDWDHHVAEIVCDCDFGDPEGKRVGLFFVKPRWTRTPQNLVLDFVTAPDAAMFMKHLLGVTEFQSSGETPSLEFGPESFRLGVTGQPFPPHQGMHDKVSSVEIFKDVNERRRMYFSGKEGRIFSGWIDRHPFSSNKPSDDIIMSVKVNLVGRRVFTSKFTEKWDDIPQTLYIPKFKVNIECEMDVYYQDATETASEFPRIAAEFLHGQILVEREVGFTFKTNYGLREDPKNGATLYLCHRSSGDISFQTHVRPSFYKRELDGLDDHLQYRQPCAMVLYIVWEGRAHVMEVTESSFSLDGGDPNGTTLRVSNQPPYPRRVAIPDGHSDKFTYWPLDDSLPLDNSFPISRIKFKKREDAAWLLKQKQIVSPDVCYLCKTRSKRIKASQVSPDNIHEGLKMCLLTSLATASLMPFEAKDEETSQLIHPFSHAVKQFLGKKRNAANGQK